MKVMTVKKIPHVVLLLLTVSYCVFVFIHEWYAGDQVRQQLTSHALIIADDLWNLNPTSSAEYLKLAAENDHFEELKVVGYDGGIFQRVGTSHPDRIEKLLIKLGLLSRVDLRQPVEYRGTLIGWLEVIWLPQTLFLQFFVLCYVALTYLAIVLYCSTIAQNLVLEERVLERTGELTRANEALHKEIQDRIVAEKDREELRGRLERSQKMESLGLLAGGVAHDLNNVLSGIVSYPDLLLFDLPPDSPLRPGIETIKNSGLRAAEIVQDLLTMARRGVVKNQVLNLNQLVDEYCSSPEHLKLLESYPDLRVERSMAEDLPPILGSAVALKKVIMNVLVNGAEAQHGSGTIFLETGYLSLVEDKQGFQLVPAGNYVLLRVVDQGEGIEKGDLQRIFEPFYTKKVMGRSGTGLGLTVVWGTVEDHQGAIDIASSPGSGTTIDIYLPVTDKVIEQQHQVSPPELMGNGEQILVVDDIDMQRKIAKAILERMNYQVDTVGDGREAIAWIQQRKADLVVLDMILGDGLDGLDTYREMLKIRPGQRAIIASGFSQTERVREAQRLGAASYIRKPYSAEQLAIAVLHGLMRGPM